MTLIIYHLNNKQIQKIEVHYEPKYDFNYEIMNIIIKDNILHVYLGSESGYGDIVYHCIDLKTEKVIHKEIIRFYSRNHIIKYNESQNEIIHYSKRKKGIKLNIYKPQELIITELFALMVLYTDDYLIKSNTFNNIHFNRFLDIIKKLPIELQMNICNKTYNSNKQFVLSKNFELIWRSVLI